MSKHLLLFSAVAALWVGVEPSVSLASSPGGEPARVARSRAALAKALGCRWHPVFSSCFLRGHGGPIQIELDPVTGQVTGVEWMILTGGEPRHPRAERRDAEEAERLIRYFLPEWRDGPRWIRHALAWSKDNASVCRVKVGNVTVALAQSNPVDLPQKDSVLAIALSPSFQDGLPADAVDPESQSPACPAF